jgi:hypothetical protein
MVAVEFVATGVVDGQKRHLARRLADLRRGVVAATLQGVLQEHQWQCV